MHQEFVVETRRLQRGQQSSVPLWLVLVDAQRRATLVAESEFENPILRRLKTRRFAEDVAEFGVFAWRECIQYFPLAVKLILDMPYARENLVGWGKPAILHLPYGAANLMD